MPLSASAFLEIIQSPFKFTFFLLTRLPAAYFSGVRVKYADMNQAVVTIPYKWFSKNPFKSTYFACLSMAAEMSTGILAMMYTYEQTPAISMLVIKVEGNFMKKATGITTFTCEDGNLFQQAIREAAASGKSTTVQARSIGKDKEENIVAEFIITWSFKAKPN